MTNENRLRTLHATQLLDSPLDRAFERLTRLAAALFHGAVPMLRFAADQRAFFEATVGHFETQAGDGFCDHVASLRAPLIVGDLRTHATLATHAEARDGRVLSLAGVPLTVAGEVVGAFCVAEAQPRAWTSDEVRALTDLAETIAAEISLRLALRAERDVAIHGPTDSLTGLLNRRGFSLIAEQAIKTAARTGQSLSLFFLDLNGMKGINDTLGHELGDQALVETAALLRRVFRASDVVARLGGDEFVVLATDAARENEEVVATRVRAAVDERNISSTQFRLSLSIGMSIYDPNAPVSLDRMLSDADARTHQQKQARHSRPDGSKTKRSS